MAHIASVGQLLIPLSMDANQMKLGWWSSYLSLTDRYMPLMCRNSFALHIPNSFHFLRFQRWLMEIIWMWNEYMYIMGCKLNWHLYWWPALLISDDFVRSNKIHKIHICDLCSLHELCGCVSSNLLSEKMIYHKIHICNLYIRHE